jgi:hypothetical protein
VYLLPVECLKKGDRSEVLGVDEKVILKWILEKWGLRVWIGLLWLTMGTDVGLL